MGEVRERQDPKIRHVELFGLKSAEGTVLNLARFVRTAMATHLSNVERLSLSGEGCLGSGRLQTIRHVELCMPQSMDLGVFYSKAQHL